MHPISNNSGLSSIPPANYTQVPHQSNNAANQTNNALPVNQSQARMDILAQAALTVSPIGTPAHATLPTRHFVHARRTQGSTAPQPFLLPQSAWSAMQTSSSSSSSSSFPTPSTSQSVSSVPPSFTTHTQQSLTQAEARDLINGIPRIKELRRGRLEPVDDRINDMLAELFKNTTSITEQTLDAILSPTARWSFTVFNLGKMNIAPATFREALFPSTSTTVSTPAAM